MAKLTAAAPIDGAAILPDALIEQFVKPADDQAMLVDTLRLAALMWVEQHTGRSLQRRAWTATFDGFNDALRLDREPVRAVSSVSYLGASGAAVPVDGRWDGYRRALPAAGQQWPADAGVVTVTFEAGYDSVEMEAPGLRVAALMLVKHLFDGGALDDVPATVTMLLDAQYRTPVMG